MSLLLDRLSRVRISRLGVSSQGGLRGGRSRCGYCRNKIIRSNTRPRWNLNKKYKINNYFSVTQPRFFFLFLHFALSPFLYLSFLLISFSLLLFLHVILPSLLSLSPSPSFPLLQFLPFLSVSPFYSFSLSFSFSTIFPLSLSPSFLSPLPPTTLFLVFALCLSLHLYITFFTSFISQILPVYNTYNKSHF